MPYSSKVANSRATLVNQNQGGGNKKMGLYPLETLSVSARRALNGHTMTLKASQTQKSWQKNVSPLAGMRFTQSVGVDHW
jgi:hypothetical protein